ncbi:MAG: apolipoprotein acyltransferase [Pseudomonadota bacterium]
MIVLIAGIFGGILGYTAAKKREGNRLDMAQYATGYAIAFMLLGLFLTLLVERLLV